MWLMKATRMRPFGLVMWATLSVSGCAMLLPHRNVPDEGALPERFSDADAAEAGVSSPDRWWEAFGSAELNGLVETGLSENLSLRQAWARLDQAGAVAVQAGAPLQPGLSLDSGASWSRRAQTVEQTVPVGDGSQTRTVETQIKTESRQFSVGLAASYEVDLWGRVRSARDAAVLDAMASRDDVGALAMSLAAEITDRWVRILERRAQLALLAEQLETNRTYLDLVELRFRKAMVSALDVYQQRQAVADIEQQIPLVQAQGQVLRHELAVLLARPPRAAMAMGEHDIAVLPAVPGVGVPADLLGRRPDVQAALARLLAADRRVAVARADRLPAIRLTGRAAYEAGDIEFLFDDWFANLAAGLTAPLLDGSRRAAEVDRTRAVVEERLAAYRLTVLTAVGEVEDAMVRERYQREHLVALETQLDAAEHALDQATQRYRKGLNDYLPVLDGLERTQGLKRNVLLARRDLLIYRVNLYRALGGRWQGELDAPVWLSEQGNPDKQNG